METERGSNKEVKATEKTKLAEREGIGWALFRKFRVPHSLHRNSRIPKRLRRPTRAS